MVPLAEKAEGAVPVNRIGKCDGEPAGGAGGFQPEVPQRAPTRSHNAPPAPQPQPLSTGEPNALYLRLIE